MGRQKHRGQHDQDAKLFSSEGVAVLNEAIKDLAFLFSRNYADNAALTLVGDRYQLRKRQRLALMRACCPDDAIPRRIETHTSPEDLADKWVYIDGYNLLITMESILSGGIILHCRDGCYRDISSVHGTYRRVEETHEALLLLGKTLTSLHVKGAYWYLDAPVSNSGRLKSLMYELATDNGFHWEIELVNNPDQELANKADEIVISSDRWILDHSSQWFNLTEHILKDLPEVHITEIRGL
jgi:hypothetical protein